MARKRTLSKGAGSWGRRASILLALGVVALPLSLGSSPAFAATRRTHLPTPAEGHGGKPTFTGDLYMSTKTPMTPSVATAPHGGLTPNSIPTYNGGGQWTCNDPLDVISNKAAGVMIGNCTQGSVMNRTQYTGPDAAGHSYFGGYISGSYNACGWVRGLEAVSYRDGANYNGCGPNGTPNDTLFSSIGFAYNSSSDNFGTYTTTQGGNCYFYGNVRPWLNTLQVSNLVPGRILAGTPVYWRYIVGKGGTSLSTDPTGQDWIALYYSGAGWVFAPYQSCFNNPALLPAGTGGYWFPPAGV